MNPLDDLPTEDRIVNALMMRAFLEGIWRREPDRRWWFNSQGEQAEAIKDLAAAGKLIVLRDLDGNTYAARRTA